MMGDDIFDLGVENEALRGKLEVNEKLLIESKNRIILSYDDSRKKISLSYKEYSRGVTSVF